MLRGTIKQSKLNKWNIMDARTEGLYSTAPAHGLARRGEVRRDETKREKRENCGAIG